MRPLRQAAAVFQPDDRHILAEDPTVFGMAHFGVASAELGHGLAAHFAGENAGVLVAGGGRLLFGLQSAGQPGLEVQAVQLAATRITEEAPGADARQP